MSDTFRPIEGAARDAAMNAALARNWWAVALRGVLGILFAVATVLAPGAVLLSLALLFGAYLLADGLLGLLAAARAAAAHERWDALLGEAGLNLLMGVLALLFPGDAVLGFVLVVGAWAAVSGVMMLSAAAQLEPPRGRWWLAGAGLASILFGMTLGLAPLLGAVVLGWWLGCYALVFGVALLVLGLRLRGHRAVRGAAVAG
jgi:uncharacterized membrane protein HdeD (DUF308 family)